jgi:hypothetical protein
MYSTLYQMHEKMLKHLKKYATKELMFQVFNTHAVFELSVFLYFTIGR